MIAGTRPACTRQLGVRLPRDPQNADILALPGSEPRGRHRRRAGKTSPTGRVIGRRLGCDLGSAGTPNACSGVRLLDGPQFRARRTGIKSNAATEGAGNGAKRGPNPRGIAEAYRVQFLHPPPWRVGLPARSSAFQAEEAGPTPARATLSLSSSWPRTSPPQGENPGSNPGRDAAGYASRTRRAIAPSGGGRPLPPVIGRRPGLRSQAQVFESPRGYNAGARGRGAGPISLLRQSDPVRRYRRVKPRGLGDRLLNGSRPKRALRLRRPPLWTSGRMGRRRAATSERAGPIPASSSARARCSWLHASLPARGTGFKSRCALHPMLSERFRTLPSKQESRVRLPGIGQHRRPSV